MFFVIIVVVFGNFFNFFFWENDLLKREFVKKNFKILFAKWKKITTKKSLCIQNKPS